MTGWEGNIDTETCVKGGWAHNLLCANRWITPPHVQHLRRQPETEHWSTVCVGVGRCQGSACSIASHPAPSAWPVRDQNSSHFGPRPAGLLAVLESDRELNGRWYDFAGREVPW